VKETGRGDHRADDHIPESWNDALCGLRGPQGPLLPNYFFGICSEAGVHSFPCQQRLFSVVWTCLGDVKAKSSSERIAKM
jgi:hypothetical protein